MTGYELSRKWFDFCFENPDKIKPIHTAIYFFAVEHCNRLGWKKRFGFPTTMAMEAIGIHSYNTYRDALQDLVDWKFIDMVEKSKNQYSSNIIALSKFDEPLDEALDEALMKHSTKHDTKQSESTVQSIDSINKQLNHITNKPKTIYSEEFDKVWSLYLQRGSKKKAYEQWKKLPDEEKEIAKQHIPKYIDNIEQKEYIVHFERYLRDEYYYMDIVKKNSITNNQHIDYDEEARRKYGVTR